MLFTKYKRLLFLGMGVLLGIVLLVAGYNAFQKHILKNEATGFVSKVLSNDSTGSYNQFSAAGQKSTDKLIWKNQVNRLSKFFKGQEPVIDSISKQPDTTIVTMSITGNDKTPYTFTLNLTRHSFGWDVESFTSNTST